MNEIELGKVLTINKWKRKVNEDTLLDEKILKLLSRIHGSVYRIIRHSRINGKEIDAIVYCKTTEARLSRYIGIELKEYDLKSVVEQAIERRSFFDYFYIVTAEYSSHYAYLGRDIKMLYKQKLLGKMIEMGIGWILKFDDPIIIFPSSFIRNKMIPEWEKWLK